LAKGSFDEDMLTDPNGAIDKLEDLTAEEWEVLKDWDVSYHLRSKENEKLMHL
jgi:hypothetical protein